MTSLGILRLLPIVWVGAGAVSTAQSEAAKAQEAFARGVERQQHGDLAGARQAYEAALKMAPRRVDVLSNLGLVYSKLGEPERGIKCFNEALAIDPRQPVVRFNLGLAYMSAGQFDQAQGELAKVVQAQPGNLAAHNLLGLCLLKLDRLGEGVKELEVVRRGNPQDLEVAYTLASAYIKGNQLDKAEPIVRELEGSDTPEAHFIVGSYYLAKFDHRRAVNEFTRTLEQNPRLPDAHAQLAYAYFFGFQWDLSVKMCEEELALNPDDDNAVKLLGSLYRQRGRLDEARALLNKAISRKPDDYEILYQIALLAQAETDYPRAVALLEQVIRLNPNFPPPHVTLVRAYNKVKREDDAKREQAIVDRLNAERSNQPTVRDKALYDTFKTPQ